MSECVAGLWAFIKKRKKLVLGLNLVSIGILCLGLVICNFQGCSGDSSSPATPVTAPTIPEIPSTFPLVTSANHRYLQDQNGVPFPILGRTAWFITSLSDTDYKVFINDTVAKGFNAIEFHVINHDERGSNPPFGGNGALPFTKQLDGSGWAGVLSYGNPVTGAPDFTSVNQLYWAHVDAIIAYAESKGVLCFIFPAYAGYQGGSQGWMVEMVANGSAKMKAYGAFIADRYKTSGNIVWMLGGDYGPFNSSEELAVEQAMLAGMQSISGQRSTNFSAEWSNPSIYTDIGDATLLAAGTLQGAFSWQGKVNTWARNGYSHFPVWPTFLLEEPYDEEGPDGNSVNPSAIQPVRRFQWWGWLSGIGGYISGNGCVWPFNPSRFLPLSFCSDGWQAHLNTQGAYDMARLNAFIRSVPWFQLVPSGLNGMKTLVIAGGSQPNLLDYVAAAASPDGTLLVAYVPPDHSGPFTVDMTVMSGPTRARWFDPAVGAFTRIVGSPFANTGSIEFTTPGTNAGRETDWVLILEVP